MYLNLKQHIFLVWRALIWIMVRKLCIYWTDTVTTVSLPSCGYALDLKT